MYNRVDVEKLPGKVIWERRPPRVPNPLVPHAPERTAKVRNCEEECKAPIAFRISFLVSQSRPFSPLLWLLFCASGAAALIYELVWFQLIQLVIGSTGVSLGLLLGTFMGGMCLGSLAVARVVPVGWHPLRVYALLEFSIGICGLALLWLLPSAAKVSALCGTGLPGFFGRGLLCGRH